MLHIKSFISKVSSLEARSSKDVVMPMSDARGLRDEISLLLADLNDLRKSTKSTDSTEIIQVEIKGASF